MKLGCDFVISAFLTAGSVQAGQALVKHQEGSGVVRRLECLLTVKELRRLIHVALKRGQRVHAIATILRPSACVQIVMQIRGGPMNHIPHTSSFVDASKLRVYVPLFSAEFCQIESERARCLSVGPAPRAIAVPDLPKKSSVKVF